MHTHTHTITHTQITILNLSSQGLQGIHVGALTHLRELNVSDNLIQSVLNSGLEHCDQLTHINLGANLLGSGGSKRKKEFVVFGCVCVCVCVCVVIILCLCVCCCCVMSSLTLCLTVCVCVCVCCTNIPLQKHSLAPTSCVTSQSET